MTKKEKTKKLIFIIFLLIICLVLIYIYKIPPKQNTLNRQYLLNTKQVFPVINTILEINETKYETEIAKNETVYDLMNKLKTEGKINFKEKTYFCRKYFVQCHRSL